ncbi:NAD(P)-dependent oxidoreductase [Cyanothece sp. BG0011]|uniref:SDR family oxidoreductase n=1 Tax=Cyanothece sp. BG0011 TaxID=2082950 RepID=UPI000D1EA705|nr:NAD(P)-dependent oxidoreductase [Cyanothece sp. BG0011]
MTKKLLITGASGFLGYNVCQYTKANWQVYGTYYRNKTNIDKVKYVKVDVTNIKELQTVFNEIKPDAVIHLAAASKPNYCQNNPEDAYKINVTASVNIAQLCANLNIPCVFTSTDLVFNGSKSPYKETDPVSPISYYGEQKVKAEEKMLAIYPKIVICRMPLMFGLPSPHGASFIQFFLDTFRQGKELSLFTDEYRTPVSGLTAAKGLLLALEKAEGEILHLGGKERISRYKFGHLMAEIFAFSPELITPCLQQDVPMSAPRSPDTALDSSKAFKLGYQPLSLREELKQLKDQL